MAGRRGTKRHETAPPGDKDALLALALAEGCSRVEAARRAGMGLRTVFTRLKDPDFAAEVRRLVDAMTAEAVRILSAGCVEAAEALRKRVRSDDDAVSIAASKAILASRVRLGSYEDIAARLEALEQETMKRGGHAP